MKYLLIISIIAFIFASCFYIQKVAAQKNEYKPIVQTISDAKKLELNQAQFIEKPLKDLLKEIKPEIKMAIGNPTNTSIYSTTYFSFLFIDYDESRRFNLQKKQPTRITVFIGQDYEHPPTKEMKGYQTWTKEDEKTYGDMKVVGVRVIEGDDAKEEYKK